MISGNVLSVIPKKSIYEFLKSNDINFQKKAKEYKLDTESDGFYPQLLNQLILNREMNKNDVNEFLIDELNYGKMKNVFVKIIDNITIKNLRNAIKRIKTLEDEDIKNASKVSKKNFIKDLWSRIEIGERKLVYSRVECEDNEVLKSISLLIAEGIKVGEQLEHRSNNY